MAKNKGGRPPKLNNESVKKLEEAFAFDATAEEACFYADISRQTYYTWLKKHPELSDRFEALRNKPILKARQTIVNKISESYGNAMDYLKRKRKNEFGDSVIIQGNVDGLNDEQKAKLDALLGIKKPVTTLLAVNVDMHVHDEVNRQEIETQLDK